MRKYLTLLLIFAIGITVGWVGTQVFKAPVTDNKALASRFYEVFNQGNFDALDEFVASDYVDHNPAPGQAAGREGLKQALIPFKKAFPDMQIRVEDAIAEGDRVVMRLKAVGTHQGEFLGNSPTGKRVEIDAIDIWRAAGGKLVEAWHLEDLLGLMQQLR